jgi:hypothetical protein
MEIFGMLVFSVVLFGLGIVLAIGATLVTRNFSRGRGAIVLAASFSPFLFVGYLLLAGYLRNEFHYDRREASNLDGIVSSFLTKCLQRHRSARAIGRNQFRQF